MNTTIKNLLTATALTLASGTVMADGFAPWNDRAVNDPVASAAADVPLAGFGPWRDATEAQPAVEIDDVRAITDVHSSAFRPWS